MDPTTLAKALRAEQAAQSELTAAKADFDRAQEMSQTENRGRTLFSALGTNFERSRGYDQLESARPRLEAARKQAASTYGAQPIYNAQVSAEKTRLDRARQAEQDRIAADERDYERNQDALTNQYNRDRLAASESAFTGQGQLYHNPKTGKELAVFMTRSGPVLADGTAVPSGFVPKPAGNNLNAGFGSARSQEVVNQLISSRAAIDRIAQSAENFTPEDFQNLERAGDRLRTEGALNLAPAAWQQFVRTEFSGYSPRVQDFLEQVGKFSAVERNRLFGSALTELEYASSQAFTPDARALAMDAMLRRLAQSDAQLMDDIRIRESVSGRDYSDINNFNALQQLQERLQERENTPAPAQQFEGFSIVE